MAKQSLDPHVKHIGGLISQLKLEYRKPFRDIPSHKKQKKIIAQLFNNFRDESLQAFDTAAIEYTPTIDDVRAVLLTLKKESGGNAEYNKILKEYNVLNPNGFSRGDYADIIQRCTDFTYVEVDEDNEIEVDEDNAAAIAEAKRLKKEKKKRKKAKKARKAAALAALEDEDDEEYED
ncbi:MAG: hypothetical protein GY941_19760 [Planctomycetes bacterium]|nr:hypothetical protein [Planctomycetota bacterium]